MASVGGRSSRGLINNGTQPNLKSIREQSREKGIHLYGDIHDYVL